MSSKLADVVDAFLWGLEVLSRKDCGLILAGLRLCQSDWEANQLLYRMERRQWIQREGRGANARFVVTETGARQTVVLDPVRHWDVTWDGKWRFFTYDLPEKRRRERVLLWRALRARKLGFLQRSVWVWPHNVEPMLQGILQATGIPECFCGLEGKRLLLCTHTELVSTAWDFEKINAGHQEYLEAVPRFFETLQNAPDLREVARAADRERRTYLNAFSLDPLLPRPLWPESYRGGTVEQRHAKFRAQLRRRMRALAQM